MTVSDAVACPLDDISCREEPWAQPAPTPRQPTFEWTRGWRSMCCDGILVSLCRGDLVPESACNVRPRRSGGDLEVPSKLRPDRVPSVLKPSEVRPLSWRGTNEGGERWVPANFSRRSIDILMPVVRFSRTNKQPAVFVDGDLGYFYRLHVVRVPNDLALTRGGRSAVHDDGGDGICEFTRRAHWSG